MCDCRENLSLFRYFNPTFCAEQILVLEILEFIISNVSDTVLRYYV